MAGDAALSPSSTSSSGLPSPVERAGGGAPTNNALNAASDAAMEQLLVQVAPEGIAMGPGMGPGGGGSLLPKTGSSYSLASTASSNPSLSRLESIDSSEGGSSLQLLAPFEEPRDPLALLAEQVGLPVEVVRERVREAIAGGGGGGPHLVVGGRIPRPLTQIASDESMDYNQTKQQRVSIAECKTMSSSSFGGFQ